MDKHLEGVAVDCKLEVAFDFLRVHRLSRGLEFSDRVVLFNEVDNTFKVDSEPLAGLRIDDGDDERDFRAFDFLVGLTEIEAEQLFRKNRELHLFLASLVTNLILRFPAVPVGIENLVESLHRDAISVHPLLIEPGKRRMDGAPEG